MIKLEAATLTDPGRERDVNEDRAWAQVFETSEGGPLGLFIVCDGMGGHLGGEFASHWAVETIKHELADMFCLKDPRATVRLTEMEINAVVEGVEVTRQSVGSKVENQVQQALQNANKVVYEYAKQRPQKAADAGTTATVAVVFGYWVVIANVGDSRTYILRDNELRQISKDHSLVASLVASGQLQPDEIFTHPQRNMIYRSLGQKREVKVDVFREIVQSGDYLFLCSDGVWEMLRDDAVMARLIEKADSPALACKKLVEAANTAGGEDNISVVVVKMT